MLSTVEKAVERPHLRSEEHLIELGIRPVDHPEVWCGHRDIQSQLHE